MKTKIIPAQVTTVEDKIAGNLNLTQIMLLMTPVFVGVIIYIFFPPFSRFSLFKLVLIFIGFFIFLVLSVRIKEKLILDWLIIIMRFNLRPKYFVYDKNSVYLRDTKPYLKKKRVDKKFNGLKTKQRTNFEMIVKNEYLFERVSNNLVFRPNKKGGINVISQ